MATQTLLLSIIASETSTAEVLSIINGCQVTSISGTVNTKYRDYAGEDILLELNDVPGIPIKRAEHSYDDGASMITISMIVPESERSRMNDWIMNNHVDSESAGALQDYTWGVKVGDSVDVETIDGVLNIEFRGSVIGFKDVYAQVEDMNGDVFDVELEDITIIK